MITNKEIAVAALELLVSSGVLSQEELNEATTERELDILLDEKLKLIDNRK